MCGIFAYVTHGVERTRQDIVRTLLNGLRRLEYRGYDSAGIAIDDALTDPSGHRSALVIKSPGTVAILEAQVWQTLTNEPDFSVSTHVGLAHTRWATHGAPSVRNSHPHSSGPGHEFLVVHNGIITNYAALREVLLKKGFHFESDTDTEVVAKLLAHLYTELCGSETPSEALSFPRLVMLLMHELEGAYALIIRSQHFPGEVVACKRGSPLVMGMATAAQAADMSSPQGSPQHEYLSGDGGGSSRSLDSLPTQIPSSGMKGGLLRRTPRRDPSIYQVAQVGLETELPRGFSFHPASPRTNGRPAREGDPRCELFFASDASAIVEHTRQVVVLEDSDVVHVDSDGEVDVFSFMDEGVQRAVTQTRALITLDFELEQIMRGNFDHFMLKEIFEQPDSLVSTMRGRFQASTRTVHLGGLRERLADILRSSRLIFVGCGTSYNAALACRHLMEQLTELPVAVEMASDFLDRRCPIFRSDVCFFLSQSGETADTLDALRYAKQRNALTVGVVNVVGSAIARLTDCGVHLNAGCEIGVASTKVYTSQIVAMVMIGLLLSADRLSKAGRRAEIMDGLARLPEQVRRVLQMNDALRDIACTQLCRATSILLFGRGFHYATCLEAALKIKEVSYVHTEGIHAGELKHGPLALVDEEMPIVLFAMRDDCYDKVKNALQQVLARGGSHRMIVVCCEGDEDEFRRAGVNTVLAVPPAVDCLQVVLGIIPMQLIAYHMAVARGLNVDQPRNLAKSVTVQ